MCRSDLCTNCSDPKCQRLEPSTDSLLKLGLAVSTIKDAGFGLFALEPLKKGQVLGKYVGEYVSVTHDTV